MMNLAVNCALVFNQYVNPVAMKALEWKYYIVYCVFLAFEFVFCWFFIIETKSKCLPCPTKGLALTAVVPFQTDP